MHRLQLPFRRNGPADLTPEDPPMTYEPRTSFYVEDPSPDEPIYDPRTKTTWRLGPVFTEYKHEAMWDSEYECYVAEVVAICTAVQVGKNQMLGKQGIARIRLQIPNENGSKPKPVYYSWHTFSEARALQHFKKNGFDHAPKLLALIRKEQENGDHLAGGYLWYVITERVPGLNMFGFSTMPMSERNDVRIALCRATMALHSLGCTYGQTRRTNLLWNNDSKKIWFDHLENIDFHDGENRPATFFVHNPMGAWRSWHIASAKERYSNEVPYEEGLEEWADETIYNPDLDHLAKSLKEAEARSTLN
ncbi:hypothetical protein KEM56_006890 [Ascosphaera pollenicola]|nr:hypothetical protein KEM56_006890 [Ascosphaera pollenicola]